MMESAIDWWKELSFRFEKNEFTDLEVYLDRHTYAVDVYCKNNPSRFTGRRSNKTGYITMFGVIDVFHSVHVSW